VVNAFSRQVGAEVTVVDVGVAGEVAPASGLLLRKVAAGTADMTMGPAMTADQAQAAVEVGIEVARDLVAQGNRLLAIGDMGIGNTTASAALISVFTGRDVADVTGRGTGIDNAMLEHKVSVIEKAIRVNEASPKDPAAALAAVGGLEHAAMVGFLLAAAALRTPVILDGVIACSAALAARAIAPVAADYWVAGHRSAEPGASLALAHLDLVPLVDLELRLGEGSGAALAVPLVQASARLLREVATFGSAGVTDKA
jgi:nicotinate-nucleotide--dimethylbenzimidazole phosphoribosyltransferase